MGTSRKSSDGVIYHSDDDGNYTGASRPTLGGRYVDYDKDGNVVGHTSEFGGSLVHYDKNGNVTGRSIKGLSENSWITALILWMPATWRPASTAPTTAPRYGPCGAFGMIR